MHPDKVKRNSDARADDVLILGKPLGVGILSAVLKKGQLDQAGYAQMIEFTTRLNTPGVALAELPGVHALTDITGFGLAGHLLEICRGSRLAARIELDALPVIGAALEWVKKGVATGASERNWNGYGADVALPAGAPDWVKKLVTDPQTSGGLLVACAPEDERRVLDAFAKEGFSEARRIGRLAEGPARVAVV